MKKYALIFLGALSFGLGTLGIFLPFLPTTVFYLLTGFCWLRSSDKLYQKFVQSDRYQRYVEEPLIRKNISTSNMLKMFAAMLVVFSIPGLLVENTPMRISLVFVYLAHVVALTWHLRFRNKKVKVGESA